MNEFCSKCGESVNYQMNFCSKCGNNLNLPANEKLYNLKYSKRKSYAKEKIEFKKNKQNTRDFKSSLIIIFGAISFLIILGDIIGFILFDKNISIINSYREFFLNNNFHSLEDYFLFISQILFTTILPFIFIILLMGKMKESIIPSFFLIFAFIITYLINSNKTEIDDYNVNNNIMNDTINTFQSDTTLIDSNLYE